MDSDSRLVLVRPRGAPYLEVQRYHATGIHSPSQQPPQPMHDLADTLRTKSINKYQEAWKDMVAVQRHEHASQKYTDAADEIDMALEVSSEVLPSSFSNTPACRLLRRESSENRAKSSREFQDALDEHYKASYEKGQAETYKEDAQMVEDELKKEKKKGSRKKSTTIIVSPVTRWNFF